MALSEREQRLLEEMERNLYQNEADILTTSGVKRQPNYTAIAIGAIVALAGLVTMLIGVYQDLTLVGVIGFAILFAGVMVAVATPGRTITTEGGGRISASGGQASRTSGTLMDRLNERWDRRHNGDGF